MTPTNKWIITDRLFVSNKFEYRRNTMSPFFAFGFLALFLRLALGMLFGKRMESRGEKTMKEYRQNGYLLVGVGIMAILAGIVDTF
jgi:hypothetical protein